MNYHSTEKTYCYVGNWSKEGNAGIGIYHYAPDGSLTFIKTVREDISSGYVCIDQTKGVLYCVDERPNNIDFGIVGGGGRVFAFKIDDSTGDLTEINHRSTFTSLPCYVSIDKTGSFLMVSNHAGRMPITKVMQDDKGNYYPAVQYDDAAVVLYALNEDGSIGDATDYFVVPCESNLPTRNPHLHSIIPSAVHKVFAVCDKGLDKLYMLTLDSEKKKFLLNDGATALAPEKSAPRYGTFHPSKPYFFMNHERSDLITAYRYDEEGRTEAICTLHSAPEDLIPSAEPSDIRISSDGKFLYAFLRKINYAAVFSVSDDGQLSLIQHLPLDGNNPRGINLTPDGKHLIVAYFLSKEVRTLDILPDGTLALTDKVDCHQLCPGNVNFYVAK